MIKVNIIYLSKSTGLELKRLPKGFSTEGIVLNYLGNVEMQTDILLYGNTVKSMINSNGIAFMSFDDYISENVYIVINNYIMHYSNDKKQEYTSGRYKRLTLLGYKLSNIYDASNSDNLKIDKTLLSACNGLADEQIQQILSESTEVVE